MGPNDHLRRRRVKRRVKVHELLATRASVDKLGARGISTREAEQLPRNHHVTTHNPREAPADAERVLLIGRTDGGRRLTLVIERTEDPSVWLIVTGWPATVGERTILGE